MSSIFRPGDLVIVTNAADPYVGRIARVERINEGSEYGLSLEAADYPRPMAYREDEVTPLTLGDGERIAEALAVVFPEVQVAAAVETEAVVILTTPRGHVVTVHYERLVGTTVALGVERVYSTPFLTIADDAVASILFGALAAL